MLRLGVLQRSAAASSRRPCRYVKLMTYVEMLQRRLTIRHCRLSAKGYFSHREVNDTMQPETRTQAKLDRRSAWVVPGIYAPIKSWKTPRWTHQRASVSLLRGSSSKSQKLRARCCGSDAVRAVIFAHRTRKHQNTYRCYEGYDCFVSFFGSKTLSKTRAGKENAGLNRCFFSLP